MVTMLLWVSSFRPLIKVGSRTALGIAYGYTYLSRGIEPRFKTDFGSYLALSAWKRMIFHLSGTLGSPLGAGLVAVIADERLWVAKLTSWAAFWIVLAINGGGLSCGIYSRNSDCRIADCRHQRRFGSYRVAHRLEKRRLMSIQQSPQLIPHTPSPLFRLGAAAR
jgi:hypothetical protein